MVEGMVTGLDVAGVEGSVVRLAFRPPNVLEQESTNIE